MFEIGEPQALPFQLTVDGTTGTVSGSEWGRTEFLPNVDVFVRSTGTPTNISQLENDNFSKTVNWNTYPLLALAIDLSELGVSPLAEVSTIQFGTSPGRPFSSLCCSWASAPRPPSLATLPCQSRPLFR